MKIIPQHIPFSAYRKNNKFYNYQPEFKIEHPESLLPSIKIYMGSLHNIFHKPCDTHRWVEQDTNITNTTRGTTNNRGNMPVITWLGHATMLIQVAGKTILTDPIFTTPSILFKRILPAGIALDKLPKIDIVLISHNHRDHMDSASLDYIAQKFNPLFLVPMGDKAWFLERYKKNLSAQKISNTTNIFVRKIIGTTRTQELLSDVREHELRVEEFLWWEQYRVSPEILLTFVPAWHWSQRNLFDHNRSLWGGWMIEAVCKQDALGTDLVKKIYFAGDTAYNKFYFQAIAEHFSPIDCAILPIGPGDPDLWMRRSHMNACQAGQAFVDCQADYLVPMHWGTFYFGHDSFSAPLERLITWWDKYKNRLHDIPENTQKFKQELQVLKFGQSFCLK